MAFIPLIRPRSFFGLLSGVAFLASFSGSGRAASTWIGSDGGAWNAAGNWTPSGVPDSTTAVVSFSNSSGSGTTTVNIGATSKRVNQMIVSGTGNQTWTIASGTLIFAGTAPVYRNETTASASSLEGVISASGSIIRLNSKTEFNIANASETYINGTVAGAGGFTKTGNGTLTLSSANSYSGATAVNGGTLSISSDGNLGDSSGAVSFDGGTLWVTEGFVASRTTTLNAGGGTFEVSDGKVLSWQGNIKGAGGLSKTGLGVVLLGGNSTYSGATQILAGTLRAGGADVLSSDSAFTVSAGATLDLADLSQTVGSLAGEGNVLLGSGTITTGGDGTDTDFGGSISGTGGVVKKGASVLTLSGNSTYTGNTTVSRGTLKAGADHVFSAASAVTVAAGASLQLAGFDQTTGSLAGSGNVKLGKGTLTTGGDNSSTTFSGSISGTGGVIKSGSGTFTLLGSNSYSGRTTVQSGILAAGAVDVFSSTSAVRVDGGAILQLEGFDQTIETLSGAGEVKLGAAVLTTSGNGSSTFSGNISGTGGIVKNGTGTLTLSGASNTYSGSTSLLGGEIKAGAANAFSASSAVTVAAGAALQLGGFDQEIASLSGEGQVALAGGILSAGGDNSNTTFSGNFTGSGGFVKTGSGSMTVGGANSYTAATTVHAGKLSASAEQVFSVKSAFTVESGAVLDLANFDQAVGSLAGGGRVSLGTASLTVGKNNDDTTFSGRLDGSGSLVKNGTGRLVLSGNNTFSGGTTIRNGTLSGAARQAFGTGSVTLNSGATLEAAAPLTIQSLTWHGGGTIAMALDQGGSITLDSPLRMSAPGTLEFSGVQANVSYDILTFVTKGSKLDSFAANVIGPLTPTFVLVKNRKTGTTTLKLEYVGASTGKILDNGSLAYTPVNANFLVAGKVQTSHASNKVRSLVFKNFSSLQVFDTLSIGSGRMTVNSGEASVRGGRIIVPGTFNKQGGGMLSLFSNVSVGEEANVAEGTLSVNGIFAVPRLLVSQGAFLKGRGEVQGDVFNEGTLAPGNSPGTLTIAGDFVQSKTGTLQIEVASQQWFDQLLVAGNVTLAGALEVVPYAGHKFAYGQQFAFLHAKSIAGNFSTTTMPGSPGFRARFVNGGTVGTILIAPSSYALVAPDGNLKNTARALDSFISASGGDRQVVSTALDGLTAAQYPGAFAVVSPALHASLVDMSISQAFAQIQMLNQRFSSLRLGVGGFQAIGFDSEPLVYDKNGSRVADPKTLQQGSSNPRWSAWVEGNGIFSKSSGLAQIPNYRSEFGGLLVGADYRWSENFSTGLYGGYEGAYANYSNAGSARMDSALFGGYASYSNGAFYADAVIGGGYNSYKVKRPISFSSINRTASSSQDGGEFVAALNLGYDWKVSGFVLGPIAGVQYTYAGIAPFTENGAGSLDLRVSQQNASSLNSTLGGRIAYEWMVSPRVVLVPEIRMLWQHEFLNGSREIGAALDGGKGAGFNYWTATPDRDSVFAGVGVGARISDRWDFSLFDNFNFGNQTYVSQMISGSIGVHF